MNKLGAGGAILLCLASACEAQIQVNLYNDAAMRDHALSVAQKEASRILKEAGVSLSWCRRLIPGEPCPEPGPATLQVRLYPRGAESNYSVPANSLGVALTSPAPEFGFFVGVFANRVTEYGQITGCSYGLMMGHVIAHELGHLLMERSAHSRDGLMKETWDKPQRSLMPTGRLLFDRSEAREIQVKVSARLAWVERTSDGK
ncbi:MAG: hypothetical protein ABI972_05935 [Acidobacteriota bacterium]